MDEERTRENLLTVKQSFAQVGMTTYVTVPIIDGRVCVLRLIVFAGAAYRITPLQIREFFHHHILKI